MDNIPDISYVLIHRDKEQFEMLLQMKITSSMVCTGSPWKIPNQKQKGKKVTFTLMPSVHNNLADAIRCH